jgi:uncharacterized membrane protein
VIAEQLLSEEAKARIEEEVRLAELNTSAEIRVHIEDDCKEFVLDRATFIFSQLEMHKTASRNGILIYAAFKEKKLAVIGDVGINVHVQENFWNDVKDVMIQNFKRSEFEIGITQGVRMVGEKIKEAFPIQSNDKNELLNKVSEGRDFNSKKSK